MTDATYAVADWGTTSFRLWLLAADGQIVAQTEGKQGMASLTPDEYPDVLEKALSAVGASAELPVVICGMAGAAQGWREAVYIDLPAALNDVPSHAVSVLGVDRDVRILPGLAQRPPQVPDVMRGEETLLLGLALNGLADGLVCMPGTHSKWVRLEDGHVRRFSTAMTGEVFGLMATQSTLKHFTEGHQPATFAELPAFRAAAREALAAPEALLRALFTVRSAPLLAKGGQADEVAARLSGLLIGAEIAGMKAPPGSEVMLVAGDSLAETYATALAVAGLTVERLSSEEMAIAGLFHAAQLLWPAAA